MRAFHRFLAMLACGAVFGAFAAQVNVSTYHNDNSRTGSNPNETILSPANVNVTQFGKLFSVPVDGTVYAQPLYLSKVGIAGGTHNVLYVVTEHDSVYAIDADVGTVYLQVSLLPAGGSPVNSASDLGCTDLGPEVGITGTPVIDLGTGTLYVVAKSKVNGTIVQYLHALDVGTLQEKFGGPSSSIQAAIPGSGYDAIGGTVTFNVTQENQRPALLLENGHVIIGWGSHCDDDPYHGWLMSYSASTLAQEAVFNGSPNGNRSGIWMSGGGPASDANANIYIASGNGTWNGTSDFGDSIVKLGPPASGAFPVLDYFTPYDQSTLAKDNIDLGSGGLVLLPALSGRQLLAQQSKQGTIYLLDTGNLGKYCVNLTPACSGSDTQVVQEIPGASSGIWGSPAYWNGNLYWTGANDQVSIYSFDTGGSGLLSTLPVSKSTQVFAFPGPTASISSNGTGNGVLWLMDGSPSDLTCNPDTYDECLQLDAYDATDLTRLLYISSYNEARDGPGKAVRFATPTIANGKVYVGTQSSVVIFGLFASQQAAPPTFAPAAGSYTNAQSVTLSDSTAGAVIYYTTDGTTPTTGSLKYSSGTSVQISSTTTLKAIAAASGYSTSGVTSGTYTIASQGSTPIGVSLSSVDNIDGIAKTGSAVVGGGLDGKGNDYAAALLGGSLSWAGSSFSFGSVGTVDAVSSTTIALPAGNDSTVNLLGSAVNGNQTNQTFLVTYTDGSSKSFTQSLSDWHTPQSYPGETVVSQMGYRITASGATDNRAFYLYGYSFAIDSTKTVKSIRLPSNRDVVVLAIDLTPAGKGSTPAAAPTFAPAPGTYSSTQSVTLADTTPGALIYYTTNGTTPGTGSVLYSAGTPVQISSTTPLQAIAVASGYGNSGVTSGTYTISQKGTTPISVNLSAVANVAGIAKTGSSVPDGGLDARGYAYSATLLGTSVTWGGSAFTLGAADAYDAASSTIISLPAANDSTLSLLATGVDGNQINQVFIVTYTDGTSTSFTQSLSDWFAPQSYAGESQAVIMPYRIIESGATDNRPFNLYGYSFAINGAKTVKSIRLPSNRDVVVLAIDLIP
jgi:hypothetical protein